MGDFGFFLKKNGKNFTKNMKKKFLISISKRPERDILKTFTLLILQSYLHLNTMFKINLDEVRKKFSAKLCELISSISKDCFIK